MDEDHKEALLDNEDGEDEGDNVEEVAEGGAGDEQSSDEGGESSAESIEFLMFSCECVRGAVADENWVKVTPSKKDSAKQIVTKTPRRRFRAQS